MLTPEKILREKAIFASFIYDVVLLPIAFFVAVESGSLTMLAEVLRGIFLVSVAIFSWITLRRINRQRLGAYDFGLGKMEQVLSFLVALALCFSIACVWFMSFSRDGSLAREVGFMNVAAVGLTFLNFLANLAPLPPLYKALKTGKSVLVLTQFRTKVTKSIGSAISTICVAISQLQTDPGVSLWADRVGILIVSIVTIHAAYELMKSAIPDLLDLTLSEGNQVKINQVLARHYDDYDTLSWCRSRQSGSDIEVHVGLGFAADMQFGRVAAITRAVMQDIEAAIPGCRATVTPVVPDEKRAPPPVVLA